MCCQSPRTVTCESCVLTDTVGPPRQSLVCWQTPQYLHVGVLGALERRVLCAGASLVCRSASCVPERVLCTWASPMCRSLSYVLERVLCVGTSPVCRSVSRVPEGVLCAGASPLCWRSTRRLLGWRRSRLHFICLIWSHGHVDNVNLYCIDKISDWMTYRQSPVSVGVGGIGAAKNGTILLKKR